MRTFPLPGAGATGAHATKRLRRLRALAAGLLSMVCAACIPASPPAPPAAPALLPTATRAAATAAPPESHRGPPTPALGVAAPEFQLVLFDGRSLRLADLRGEVVVLNFWASWCEPCRWEMPAFERIWNEYRDRGVTFIGVAVSDGETDARAFAQQVGVTYPLALDGTGRIADAYGQDALPTTFFIDVRGRVARRLVGPANEGVLRIFLRGQLNGR